MNFSCKSADSNKQINDLVGAWTSLFAKNIQLGKLEITSQVSKVKMKKTENYLQFKHNIYTYIFQKYRYLMIS